jgi:predicted nucleic acid-binding protein
MALIVDASVAVKWFIQEPDSDRARALLGGSERLLAPDLIVIEVCNTAWRRAKMGDIAAKQAVAIAELIGRMPWTLEPSVELAPRATAISFALNHPVYDCFYLAAGERHEAAVVTADGRLLRRLAGAAWQRRAIDLKST